MNSRKLKFVPALLLLFLLRETIGQTRVDLVWRLPLADAGMTPIGMPAMDDERAFFATDHVVSVDRRSGMILWSTHSSKLMPRGLKIAFSRVYVVDEAISALDEDRGRTLWTRPAPRGAEFSIPEIFGTMLLVGSEEGSITLVNATTGDVERKVICEPGTHFRSIVTGIYAFGSTVYVSLTTWDDEKGLTSHGSLVALSGTRLEHLIWTLRTDADRDRSGFTAPVTISGSRLLVQDGLANRLYCVELYGKLAWRAQGAPRAYTITNPVVWKDRIYVGSADGFVYALDARTGQNIWTKRVGGSLIAMALCDPQPIAIGSALYSLSVGGSIDWGPHEPRPGEHLTSLAAVDEHGLLVAGPSALYQFRCTQRLEDPE